MAPDVLTDVNICLDLLLDRKPFVEHSGQIFELGEKGQINLYLSGLSFDTLFYIMRPVLGPAGATEKLKIMQSRIRVAPVDETVVKKALHASWPDLEDALQYYSAIEAGCKYLLTRNPRDFKGKEKSIRVLTPERFMNQIIG